MSFDFSKLSLIDAKTKDLVNGYIRNAQILLPNDNNYYNIPALITYICIFFYYEHEQFITFGANASYDEQSNSIQMQYDFDYITAYGKIEVHSTPNSIYKWTLKIIKLSENCTISIGIDSSNKRYINSNFANRFLNYQIFYAFRSNGWTRHRDTTTQSQQNRESIKYYENDTVQLTLNTLTQELVFSKINDKLIQKQSKFIVDMTQSYNLAVSITSGSAIVQIFQFQQQII